jgi:hypothetical protein
MGRPWLCGTLDITPCLALYTILYVRPFPLYPKTEDYAHTRRGRQGLVSLTSHTQALPAASQAIAAREAPWTEVNLGPGPHVVRHTCAVSPPTLSADDAWARRQGLRSQTRANQAPPPPTYAPQPGRTWLPVMSSFEHEGLGCVPMAACPVADGGIGLTLASASNAF